MVSGWICASLVFKADQTRHFCSVPLVLLISVHYYLLSLHLEHLDVHTVIHRGKLSANKSCIHLLLGKSSIPQEKVLF